uniref:Peptidase S1 domain-containing protein n=1 Tax=Gadus morhua TaxID=8049 RepID=A0A8C5FUD6_GADMO
QEAVHVSLGGKIINGKEVPPKSLLYMVSVQNDGKTFLWRILIRKDIVLTAAHCDIKPNVTVVLGTNDLRERTMRYNVKKCKHADYKDPSNGNDIMMLKNTKIKNNTPCLVAGWGYNETRGSTVDKLREVNLEWARLNKTLSPANIICAGGYTTKKGACRVAGDSGGPLVCKQDGCGIFLLVAYTFFIIVIKRNLVHHFTMVI